MNYNSVFFSQDNHYAGEIRHCRNWQGLNYWAWEGLIQSPLYVRRIQIIYLLKTALTHEQ